MWLPGQPSCLPTYLPTHPPTYVLHTHPSTYLPIHPPTYLPNHIPIYLPTYPSTSFYTVLSNLKNIYFTEASENLFWLQVNTFEAGIICLKCLAVSLIVTEANSHDIFPAYLGLLKTYTQCNEAFNGTG
jgi:hypothetical protein